MVEFRTVLLLHSSCAAFSGCLALCYPPVFGSVFPSLTTAETLAFIARIYNVLVLAQALLLSGFRKISDSYLLRRIALAYCFVFSCTAGIAYYAESIAKVTMPEVPLSPMWLALAMAYLALAVRGTSGMFNVFSYFHGAMAAFVGALGVAIPREVNYEMFKAPFHARKHGVSEVTTYDTISRYYGALIIGMSLITLTLRAEAAVPAWPRVRVALATMFAASALALAAAMWTGTVKRTTPFEDPLADLVGIFSVGIFVTLSVLYSIATLPDAPFRKQE